MTHRLLLPILLASTAFPGSVTTVPWNGHSGAISFTFDDGAPTQIKNVVPSLKQRGIHATFFLVGNSYGANLAGWKQAALDGNELANHTYSHPNLTTLDSAAIRKEIVDNAVSLRSIDPVVEAVTIAYPNCATNDMINRIANEESLIGRTCGGYARFGWSTTPSSWMATTSFIPSDTATALEALSEIDLAASTNTWMVTLNHGVGGDWGAITTGQVDAMFDRAIARKLWIATYQEVAAYWRASKTLDTANAHMSTDGWTVAWTSPHPRMPRRVPLRLRLDRSVFGDSTRVFQGSAEIVREADGTFLIDFMKLGMSVRPMSPTSTVFRRGQKGISTTPVPGDIRLAGIPHGEVRWELATPSGKIVSRGTAVLTENKPVLVLPASTITTLVRVRSKDGSAATIRLTRPR